MDLASIHPLVTISASGIVGVVSGVVGYWVKGFFEQRKDPVTENKMSLKELTESHNQTKIDVTELKGTVNVKFAEIKGSLDLAIQKFDTSIVATNKLEGKVEQNNALLHNHVTSVDHMSRQLKRLFQISGESSKETNRLCGLCDKIIKDIKEDRDERTQRSSQGDRA